MEEDGWEVFFAGLGTILVLIALAVVGILVLPGIFSSKGGSQSEYSLVANHASVRAWDNDGSIVAKYQDNTGGTNWVYVQIRNENTKEVVWNDNITLNPNDFRVSWDGPREGVFYTVSWRADHEDRDLDLEFTAPVFV